MALRNFLRAALSIVCFLSLLSASSFLFLEGRRFQLFFLFLFSIHFFLAQSQTTSLYIWIYEYMNIWIYEYVIYILYSCCILFMCGNCHVSKNGISGTWQIFLLYFLSLFGIICINVHYETNRVFWRTTTKHLPRLHLSSSFFWPLSFPAFFLYRFYQTKFRLCGSRSVFLFPFFFFLVLQNFEVWMWITIAQNNWLSLHSILLFIICIKLPYGSG